MEVERLSVDVALEASLEILVGTPQDVLTYHAAADRSGNFVVPGLTWEKAKSLRGDPDK
jgi:hypothetical protein